MSTAKVCPICCDKYDKSLHSEVKCYFQTCQFTCCKTCIRTYLTGITTDPHCMHCRNKWNLEFAKANLNASFMDNDYKTYRKVILADREIAKTSEYYEGALYHGEISEAHARRKLVNAEIKELERQLDEKERLLDEIEHEISSHGRKKKGDQPARKFIMPCQNTDCRGLLSSQYKCDLCSKFTCSKCLVCIHGEKEEHECKADDVATAEEIRKNTKPCPNCGSRISKIDGCFAAGTGIPLVDGSSKPAVDIKVGDVLIGDDYGERIVTSLCQGTDRMYDVIMNNQSYTVSSKHLLVLLDIRDNSVQDVMTEDFYSLPEKEKVHFRGLKHVKINRDLHIYSCPLEVLDVGMGQYYGFTVKGDNPRFLLTNGTVVHNCDQMFCVECKTAFSWNKGTVETGNIHNPHYYEWMRKNGGNAAMPAGNIRNGCDNDFHTIGRYLQNQPLKRLRETLKKIQEYASDQGLLKYARSIKAPWDVSCLGATVKSLLSTPHSAKFEEKSDSLVRFHQFVNHIEGDELAELRRSLQRNADNHAAIYDYILNRINKQDLANELIRLDTDSMRWRARSDILEALVMVGRQLLTDCAAELKQTYANALDIPRYQNENAYYRMRDEQWNRERYEYLTKIKEDIAKITFENEQKAIEVMTKYESAILKYTAYSNVEAIRHLLTYNSRKMLELWVRKSNGLCGRENLIFTTKTEMYQKMNEYQRLYDELNGTETTVVHKMLRSPPTKRLKPTLAAATAAAAAAASNQTSDDETENMIVGDSV